MIHFGSRLTMPDFAEGALRERGDLSGRFDYSGNTITGWAVDCSAPSNRKLTVSVVRDGEIIASAPVARRDEAGWHFEMAVDSRVTAREVLDEQVRVVVRSARGDVRVLQLEGSTQLALIKEFIDDNIPPWLVIDFREGGNSDEHLVEGWSGQEAIHRWTTGAESALVIPPPRADQDTVLELLLWPFTGGQRLVAQQLRVLVNAVEVGCFEVSGQTFLKCPVPRWALQAGQQSLVRFLHPDARSPADFGMAQDTRPLAFAFKKVVIRPRPCDGLG